MNQRNRGFTLIELIGVITIIGIILLIVFPSTMKLIKQNSDKKYNYYYDLVEDASKVYAATREDDLGGTSGVGCIDIDLATLIAEKYVKKYEEEDVTCDSPTDSSKVKIRITNDKGKVNAKVSLVCKKGTKIVFEKNVSNNSTCIAYTPENTNKLITTVQSSLAANLSTIDGTVQYVTGAVSNNYVWYSGKYWRIISIDNNTKTIKMITDDIVGTTTYYGTGTSYQNSGIYKWLNTEFLQTLMKYDNYIINDKWNYTTVSGNEKPATTNVVTSKVGLISRYEYSKIGSYLNIGQHYWLLSPKSGSDAWIVNSLNTIDTGTSTYIVGVRPVVTLKANIGVLTGGTGTKANPYRLTGDSYASTNALLNTRFSGEYAYFTGNTTKYRIVSVVNGITKIIAENNLSIGNIKYDDVLSEYSIGMSIGSYLNNTWYNSLSNDYKSMIVMGDFCVEKIAYATDTNSKCKSTADIRTFKVGLPKIGDFYTNNSNTTYWTLDRLTNNTILTIHPTTAIGELTSSDLSGVRPVVYLDSNVVITGGIGTEASPFILAR